MKFWIIKILLGLAVLSCLVSAQSPRDCASMTAALEQRLEAQRRLLTDWAGLIRYGSENTELPPPAGVIGTLREYNIQIVSIKDGYSELTACEDESQWFDRDPGTTRTGDAGISSSTLRQTHPSVAHYRSRNRLNGNAVDVQPNMPNATLMEGNQTKAMLMAVRYLSIGNRG